MRFAQDRQHQTERDSTAGEVGGTLIGAGTGLGGWAIDARIPNCRQGMGLQPQSSGGDGRINAVNFPPCGFIAAAMGLTMVAPAQRHGELITDLAAQRAVLREAQVVGVCRPAQQRGRAGR
jgi:hypothetical protein